jgi:hypothetical protein
MPDSGVFHLITASCAGMGVMYDYFAAPSDAAAAETLQKGPGGPVPAAPNLQELRRAQDREGLRRALRPRVRLSDSGLLVLATKGVDPVVQMRTLESLLTSEEYDVISERPRAGHQVAGRDQAGPWVVALTDELQAALAVASREQIVAAATLWDEEFQGTADPEAAADFVLELADLARQADQRGEHLYCWICL